MKKILISLSMFALGFMTSCQQEELIHEASQTNSSIEITATLEDDASSRTQLSPLEGDVYKVWWSEKDALSIFASEDAHSKYVVKKGVGTARGSFKWAGGDITAGTENWTGGNEMFVGVYPHSETTTIEKSENCFKINTAIPTEQTFAEGSYGKDVFPMVAVSEDHDFAFKNVGSIIIVPLKGETKIVSATLESKTKNIAGKATVTVKEENKWIPATDVTNGEKKVVVDCGEGVELKADEAKNFFFVLAPGTYEADDLSVTFTDINKKCYEFVIPAKREYKRSYSLTFRDKVFNVQN